MSEFELHQLLVASRWEFEVPMLAYIAISLGMMALAICRRGVIDGLSVRLLQLVYIMLALFMGLRFEAGLVRGQKLGVMLRESGATFDFFNPALQQFTWYERIATAAVLFLVTLVALERARKPRA